MNSRSKSRRGSRVPSKANVGRVVWAICSNKRCPRKRRLTGDAIRDLPERVAYVVSQCPWHEGAPGDYTTEEWYDKDHKQVLEDELCKAPNPKAVGTGPAAGPGTHQPLVGGDHGR